MYHYLQESTLSSNNTKGALFTIYHYRSNASKSGPPAGPACPLARAAPPAAALRGRRYLPGTARPHAAARPRPQRYYARYKVPMPSG